MFFNQEFTLRPVPDIAYEVRFIGLQQPTTLLNTTDTPSFTEWWQLIAYGAALKIFIDQSDMEQYSQLYPIFQEQINLAMRRALKQLSNQRVQTPYSENQSGSSANWPCYPTY
jgi:hypothetical protein